MINILICDDEKIQVDLMEYMIFKLGVLEKIKIYKAYSPGEFIKTASNDRIDIAFIDIRLKGVQNGIDIAGELRRINNNSILVFVTGYKEYGYDSYSVNAFDYYLKPLEEESFKSLLMSVKQEYNKNTYLSLHKHFFVIKEGDGTCRVPYSDIYYFEKIQRKVIVHCKFKTFEISNTLKKILTEKNISDFFLDVIKDIL